MKTTTNAHQLSVALAVGVLAAALAAAVAMHRSGVPPATTGLVLAVSGSPLALVLLAIDRRRSAACSAAAIALGALMAVAGAVLTYRTDGLQLLRMDFPLRQVATNAATELASVGLVAVGLALVLAGLGGRLGDRLLAGVAVMVVVATATAFAVALLGLAARDLAYIGGSFRWAPVAGAGVVFLAALLLPVLVATSRRSVQANVTPAAVTTDGVSTAGAPRGSRRTPARWIALGAVVLLLAGAGAWTRGWLGDRAELGTMFADRALAACVAAALGEPDVTQSISRRELSGVVTLTCNGDLSAGERVRALDGLDELPNLTALDLSNNEVRDLSPLLGVPKLLTLKITGNGISDLRPLARLTRLSELGASENAVSDLTPLADVTSLRHVGLAGNNVSDLAPLARLVNIVELELSSNQIADLSPLAGLAQLDRLVLARNRVTDARPLQALPALSMLDISENRITDANTLAGCPAVHELWIGGNPVADLRPLRRMPTLEGVDLTGLDPARVAGVDALRKDGVYVGGLA